MNIQKLKGKIPEGVLSEMPEVIRKFQINNSLRIAHFLAQCSHESNNFTDTVEDLNYSAEGLLKTFKEYFNLEQAHQYAHNPEKIASRVYANRMGNGDENSKEGYRYCGRGYIQLTGKNNYSAFDSLVDDSIIEIPNLVSKVYPLMASAWFFTNNGLNHVADQGSDVETIKKVTRVVNGGLKGIDERIERFNYFYFIIR